VVVPELVSFGCFWWVGFGGLDVWICKKVAILGEWLELEVISLGLNLLKLEDLGV
jgi:hypothetical protein